MSNSPLGFGESSLQCSRTQSAAFTWLNVAIYATSSGSNPSCELAQTMYEMTFTLPNDPEPRKTLLQMDDMQQRLHSLFR